MKTLEISYLISSASGFIAGVLAGYGLNKKWTFGVKKTTKLDVYKYYITYSISLILGLLILKFLVSTIGISPEIANLLIIGFTTITNFVGIKFWVFRV
jgi:putative flippase GtrA